MSDSFARECYCAFFQLFDSGNSRLFFRLTAENRGAIEENEYIVKAVCK